MKTVPVLLALTLLWGQWLTAVFTVSFDDMREVIRVLVALIKKIVDSSWFIPSVSYIVVFIITMAPALFVLRKYKQALESAFSQKSSRSFLILFFWSIIFYPLWFAPTLTLLMTGKEVGMSWSRLAIPVLIMLAISLYSLHSRLPTQRFSKKRIVKRIREFLLVLQLLVAGRILQVVILEQDDQVALRLISEFRGRYIIWAQDQSSQTPKELDEYDLLPTTVHVGVFLNGWLIGYGRVLFGCQQLLTKYRYLLSNFADEFPADRAVEISRLLVVPNLYGFRVRGSILSALVQLFIYRKFFKICEDRGTTQWWAVLGPGLLRLLKMFNFPFGRINNFEGRDTAGRFFAVKMEISEAEYQVETATPLLFRWFTACLGKKEKVRRLNGRNSLPPTTTFQVREAHD